MNRYMLFSGDCYYPSGGMYDFIMSSNVLDTLIAYAEDGLEAGAWWHIYDTQEMAFIRP